MEESFHSMDSSMSEIYGFGLEERVEAEACRQDFNHAMILETRVARARDFLPGSSLLRSFFPYFVIKRAYIRVQFL